MPKGDAQALDRSSACALSHWRVSLAQQWHVNSASSQWVSAATDGGSNPPAPVGRLRKYRTNSTRRHLGFHRRQANLQLLPSGERIVDDSDPALFDTCQPPFVALAVSALGQKRRLGRGPMISGLPR
jgi:hypothetical protein